MNATIEFCMNSEWLASSICDEHDLDHGAWRDDVANEYVIAAVAAAEKAGFAVERAQGQRIMFHGWNGAHFDFRAGVFGAFGELTAEEKAALESADAIGYEAAEKFAAERAAMSLAD